MRLRVIIATALLSSLCWFTAPASAEDGSRLEFREWGVRAGGGINPSSHIQYYAIHPYVGLSLWEPCFSVVRKIRDSCPLDDRALGRIRQRRPRADTRPTASRSASARSSHVSSLATDHSGRSSRPAKARSTPTSGSRIWEPGCSSPRRSAADSSTSSAPAWRSGFQVRFRHMSNAGMASSNPGINTVYGLLGLTFH